MTSHVLIVALSLFFGQSAAVDSDATLASPSLPDLVLCSPSVESQFRGALPDDFDHQLGFDENSSPTIETIWSERKQLNPLCLMVASLHLFDDRPEEAYELYQLGAARGLFLGSLCQDWRRAHPYSLSFNATADAVLANFAELNIERVLPVARQVEILRAVRYDDLTFDYPADLAFVCGENNIASDKSPAELIEEMQAFADEAAVEYGVSD